MAPARLTGSLLARKGQAQPSGTLCAAIDLVQPHPAGDAPGRPVAHREPLAEILVPVWRARPAGRRGGPSVESRVHLTARIDRTMHTRLRVLAARQQRTNQDIVRSALDAYLKRFGSGCTCLADADPED